MGALKVGDVISVRNGISDALSVAGQGLATSQSASPRTDGKADALAEKHNFVTIKSIATDNTPHRVYNLEVESRDGEITHNYFVGEDELWVHNGRIRGKRRKDQHNKQPNCQQCGILTKFNGPRKGPRTDRFSCDHIDPQSLGGGDGPENIQTLCVPCNARKGARS